MYKVLLAVGFLAFGSLFIKQVDSIQCFVCNSHHNESCIDPFDPYSDPSRVYRTDCNSVKGILCRKITQMVDGDYRVIRTCGWEAERKDRPSYTLASDQYKANYYNCDHDLCNNTIRSQYSTVLIGFSLIFALMRLFSITIEAQSILKLAVRQLRMIHVGAKHRSADRISRWQCAICMGSDKECNPNNISTNKVRSL